MTLDQLSSIRSPLKGYGQFGTNEVFEKIFEVNPNFPRDRQNHFDMFTRAEVVDGKSVNRIVLKVKDEENIRSLYKNPDKEIVFTVNQYELSQVLAKLNLPDEVVVETLKEFDEKSKDALRTLSGLFRDWDNAGPGLVFKNKQDPRKLAVVLTSPREFNLMVNSNISSNGLDRSLSEDQRAIQKQEKYQEFTRCTAIAYGKGEGYFDVGGVDSSYFFNCDESIRQNVLSILSKEGYGNILTDFELHPQIPGAYASEDEFGYVTVMTLDTIKEFTYKVVWVRCVEEVDQKDLDDFVTNNNLNIGLDVLMNGVEKPSSGSGSSPLVIDLPNHDISDEALGIIAHD